jgi:hypothetical protein
VVERLLLNRVDAEAGRATVGREYDLIVLPGAHEAQAALAFVQLAQPRADLTLDAPVLKQPPIASRRALYDLLIHSAIT